MINFSRALADLEARYEREAFTALSYHEALARYAALWAEARALNPELGSDWVEDLECDRAIARAVNGLSPAA